VAEDDGVPALAEEREGAGEGVSGGDAFAWVDAYRLAEAKALVFS
jgi:hypothetical protein